MRTLAKHITYRSCSLKGDQIVLIIIKLNLPHHQFVIDKQVTVIFHKYTCQVRKQHFFSECGPRAACAQKIRVSGWVECANAAKRRAPARGQRP